MLLFKAKTLAGSGPALEVPAGGTLLIPADQAGLVSALGDFEYRFGPSFFSSETFSSDAPEVNGTVQLQKGLLFAPDWTLALWGVSQATWPANTFAGGEQFTVTAHIRETDAFGTVLNVFASATVNIEITGSGPELRATDYLSPNPAFGRCDDGLQQTWLFSNDAPGAVGGINPGWVAIVVTGDNGVPFQGPVVGPVFGQSNAAAFATPTPRDLGMCSSPPKSPFVSACWEVDQSGITKIRLLDSVTVEFTIQ